MTLAHHVADDPIICRQHQDFTDRISDAVMKIQDEAYKLGRERGRTEANAELLEALQGLIGSLAKLKSGDYVVGRDSVWLDAARSAIAKATEA